jgi:hypothetical protein
MWALNEIVSGVQVQHVRVPDYLLGRSSDLLIRRLGIGSSQILAHQPRTYLKKIKRGAKSFSDSWRTRSHVQIVASLRTRL